MPDDAGPRRRVRISSDVMAKNPTSVPDSAPGAADGVAPADFESALAELEALVARMESGDLSLEHSLAAYRRGAELVTFCRRVLTDVQQQVRILEGDLLKPFDPEETAP